MSAPAGFRQRKGIREPEGDETAFFAGIDVGAATTKVAVVKDKRIVSSAIVRSSTNLKKSVDMAFRSALRRKGLRRTQVERIVATGFGRHNVQFADRTKTEIACHAKGAYFYFPKAITVVDIGGQDTKIIRLDEDGRIVNFRMNRKCAAGTGTFLEEIANRLDVGIDSLDRMARKARGGKKLNSYCTVFAATEILTRIREGERKEELVRGAFLSIINRIIEMERFESDVVLTGGVIAHNPILGQLLEKEINGEVHVPPEPQLAGAFGGALFASGGAAED